MSAEEGTKSSPVPEQASSTPKATPPPEAATADETKDAAFAANQEASHQEGEDVDTAPAQTNNEVETERKLSSSDTGSSGHRPHTAEESVSDASPRSQAPNSRSPELDSSVNKSEEGASDKAAADVPEQQEASTEEKKESTDAGQEVEETKESAPLPQPRREENQRRREDETGDTEETPERKREAWGDGKRKEDNKGKDSGDNTKSGSSTTEEPPGEDDWLQTELPIDFIVKELENDVRDGYLVRELYFYIPFLVLFLTFSLNQIPITESHYSIQALKETIVEKQFTPPRVQKAELEAFLAAGEPPMMAIDKRHADIVNDGDWGAWLEHTVEQLFSCGNLSSHPPPTTPNTFNGTGIPLPVKGQLYFIGNLRIRTLRVRPDSCQLARDVQVDPTAYPSRFNLTDQQCWASHQDAFEEKTPRCGHISPLNPNVTMYQYTDCKDIPGTWTTTETGNYQCGGYIVEIPFTTSCADALDVVAMMLNESCPFVDPEATRFVIMEMFAYTPATDAFFSAKVFNEVTAGGGWIPGHQFRGFLLFTKSLIFQTVLDFFFLAFVLYYLVAFLYDLKLFYHEERSVLRYFLNVWTLLEFTNVVTYLTVFGLRWTWWAESDKLRKSFPWPNEYPDLDQSLWVYSQMRYALAFNFILTFLKILKYLKISSKLNIISVTFEKSQQDVLGLLVIFMLVLTGYAVAGTALFGPQMWWFSTLDRSFSGLMFMLMGEMDYLAMKNINPLLAGLYFWTFLILSFFLLLNFIVAVVSEAFNQAGEQEWALPLSDAFELSIKGFFRQFGPRALLRECKLLCKRRSALYVRSQALSYIKQNKVYLHLKYPTMLDIDVRASEILRWIPVSYRDDYLPLLKEDWDMISTVYELHEASDDAQTDKQWKDVVIEGTRKALPTHREVEHQFDQIQGRILKLDEQAQRAIEGLQKKLGKKPRTSLTSPPMSRQQSSIAVARIRRRTLTSPEKREQ